MARRPTPAARSVTTRIRGGLNRIALWQLATFVLLTMLVWVNELIDLPRELFQLEPTPTNLARGAILTAAVLFTAILTIGNTHERSRRLVEEILVICARCGKVKLNADQWQNWETFITEESGCRLSHGLCPDCYAREHRAMEKQLP